MDGNEFLTWCFIYLTGFGALGVLWFRVVRPILEAVGWLRPYTGDVDYGKVVTESGPMTTASMDDAATDNDTLRRIAMGRNGDNDELSRNDSNLVLRVQAAQVARLLRADSLFVADGKGGYKKAGQGVLIKLSTGLEPNGRASSDYGQLLAELKPMLNPQITIHAGRPDERLINKGGMQ